MDRRKFVKGLTFGAGVAAAAGGVMPLLSFKENKKEVDYSKLTLANGKTPVDTFHNSQKARNGIAIGGIGTGSAELRADGLFYNWQLFNNLPLGTGKLFTYTPDSMLFFILRYQIEGEDPRLKALMIDNGEDVASIINSNYIYIYPWMSSVDKIESEVQFPFVHLKYIDEKMPVEVEMDVFSPFIPNDTKNSSLPAMLFNFKVKSKIDKPVTVTLMATYRNGAGYNFTEKLYVSDLKQKSGYVLANSGISGIAETESSFGTQSMASLSDDTTWRLGWDHTHPHFEEFLRNPNLPNIDTTNPIEGKGGRNIYDRRLKKINGMERSFSSLAVTRNLNKGEGFEHSLVYTWNFPNLYNHKFTRVEGHYYSNFFKNSGEVADYVIANKSELLEKSQRFVKDLFDSTVDPVVLNQINSHMNTFITSGWLTKSGEFGVLEGMNCNDSCCGITTIDVSMYSTQLIVSLFPDLQKSSMRFHKDLQQPNGQVPHSFDKDFTHDAKKAPDLTNRLDVAMQYAILAMRDFMWTNDRKYLEDMWPSIKKAMEYMLNRDINKDQMPDMEGIMCSYDNFPMYGLASYIHSQWLCALAMCVECAKVMKDKKAESLYSGILEKGKKLLDTKLWNGKYFRLYQTDQTTFKVKINDEEEKSITVPPIDEGCLTDQLIGQWVSHMSGLGYLSDKDKTRTALQNILKLSFTSDIGLRNCSWPDDKFLHDIPWDIWVDQANTPWTGVELAFASFLIYEGMTDEALKVIHLVDERYRRAGMYWNHQECGGHYYRAMSAWTILNAYLGLTINQTTLGFYPQLKTDQYKVLFAVNGACAHFAKNGKSLSIRVSSGNLQFQRLSLGNACMVNQKPKVKLQGKDLTKTVAYSYKENSVMIDFKELITIEEGQILEIS
jgi:non-lysosomal glucosylceramidase